MTEHPILFSSPMVRAILAGTKTQTRRVLEPQPKRGWDVEYFDGAALFKRPGQLYGEFSKAVECRYGIAGDRLWVRETGWERIGASGTFEPYYYDATEKKDVLAYVREHRHRFKRRPSIHMPRDACRLVLDVIDVRVERLQHISEKDAIAEGIEGSQAFGWRDYSRENWKCTPEFSYRMLWDSLNAKRGHGWATNPWVWVVEFKRV